MIRISHVHASLGGIPVLRDCTGFVGPGEVAVVCGPSGAGKSTLLKCVNGIVPIDSGEIVVDDTVVSDPATDLPTLRSRIGMVGQDVELFPHLSALRNVELAQRRVLRRSRSDSRAKALQMLERVGLSARARDLPGRLSAGERQRVAIARALAMDPVAMLFDEPTTGLDPEMTADVLDLLTALARDGMPMLVVTHEMGFARNVAHRVMFMDRGEIVEDSLRREFFGQPISERGRLFMTRIKAH